MHNNNGPHKMLGEVEMFRIRVATAESRLKQLREQAREAKRRRKEAKRIAQQARKQFKQSKAGLSELKQALANAEAKLFKAGGRAQARKLAKDRPPAKVRARMTKKPNQPAGKPQKASLPRSRATGRVIRKKPAIKSTETVHQEQANAGALDPNQSSPQNLDASSKTL